MPDKLTATFRVFISSTFSDMVTERDALQSQVFPALEDYCRERGTTFQAIDLRWGVDEEAMGDQRTMKICFEEITRCRQATPRPNFLILLGDRYGWMPLPAEIEAREFESLLAIVSDDEKQRLLSWYRRDDNSRPPMFNLRPRSRRELDNSQWTEEETALHAILLRAATSVLPIDSPARVKYEASATHQEVVKGVFNRTVTPGQAFCFALKISVDCNCKLPEKYFDLNKDGTLDRLQTVRVEELKNQLHKHLRASYYSYAATWDGNALSENHVKTLCSDVQTALMHVLDEELALVAQGCSKLREQMAHEQVLNEHTKHFVGRTEIRDSIQDIFSHDDSRPHFLIGPSGAGRSALLAQIVKDARMRKPEGVAAARFIGATGRSTVASDLLYDLSHEIRVSYGSQWQQPESNDFAVSKKGFLQTLALATEQRPLLIAIDGLDLLSNVDTTRIVAVANSLPRWVRMIFTSLSNDQDIVSSAEEGLIHAEPVPPLTQPEAEKVLENWLSDVGRTLPGIPKRVSVLSPYGLSFTIDVASCISSGAPLAFNRARANSGICG